MKCGPGFKKNIGFKQYGGIGEKILSPNSETWQYYRRKETNASYGTVTFEGDGNRVKLTIDKVNNVYTSVQTGIMSKEKINFAPFTKLKITYISTTTNTDNYVNQVFCGDKILSNIPDYNSNTNWRDWDSLVANGSINKNIANLGISANAVAVEYDITSITNENYLYVSNRYTHNLQTGTGNLYVYDVKLS